MRGVCVSGGGVAHDTIGRASKPEMSRWQNAHKTPHCHPREPLPLATGVPQSVQPSEQAHRLRSSTEPPGLMLIRVGLQPCDGGAHAWCAGSPGLSPQHGEKGQK